MTELSLRKTGNIIIFEIINYYILIKKNHRFLQIVNYFLIFNYSYYHITNPSYYLFFAFFSQIFTLK